MTLTTLSKVIFGAALTTAVCFASVANAGSEGVNSVDVTATGLRTVTVSYADLDMTDVKEQEVFHTRVSRAARQVCGSSHLRAAGSLRQVSKNKQCFRSAMTDALRQAPNTQVAAVE